MKQIVLSEFDDELTASIRRVAEREQISMEEAALKLLRKGAGLGVGRKPDGKIGNSLDHFIGSWSKEEAAELQAALQENHVVDESDRR